MNKKQFYTAAIVAALLSLGTFFGLNILFPYHPEEIKVGETAELKDVLAGNLAPAEPDGTPTNIGTTEELKSAPAETVPAAAETPAEPADASPETSSLNPAETAAAPAPEAPAPAEEVAAAEPAPSPAPAPAAKPEPRPAIKSATAPAPVKKNEPVKPWWSGNLEGELSAVYVGSLADKTAIVVMFNGSFDSADSLNQHASVASGKVKVGGVWELSPKNRRMAIFSVPKAGRYQLSLGSGLSDSTGKAMKKPQQGPVDVQ